MAVRQAGNAMLCPMFPICRAPRLLPAAVLATLAVPVALQGIQPAFGDEPDGRGVSLAQRRQHGGVHLPVLGGRGPARDAREIVNRDGHRSFNRPGRLPGIRGTR